MKQPVEPSTPYTVEAKMTVRQLARLVLKRFYVFTL
jgi:hypothetical protein